MIRQKFSKSGVLLAVALLCGGLKVAQAAPTVQLNGVPLVTSVPPANYGGRIVVPMRDIFEALGARVDYDSLTQGITARRGETKISLQIGNRAAQINGQAVTLDQAPIIDQGSTLVPLRFVSEALGARVEWNGTLEQASIFEPHEGGFHHDGGPSHDAIPHDGDHHDGGPVGPRDGGPHDGGHAEAPRPPSGQVASYEAISIPGGTVVPVTLDRGLSSATARDGDMIMATVKSTVAGDSEFESGTKIEGVVTQVVSKHGDTPGALDIEFRAAILPDHTRVSLSGTPIQLDSNSVTSHQGRFTAKQQKDETKRDVLIGGGSGFVLGKVTGHSSTVTGLLGAAAGYILGQKDRKGKDVDIAAGTSLGVRLDAPLSYSDNAYEPARERYMKL